MEKNLKSLKKIGWYFILFGLIELFVAVLISSNFVWGIIGLLTIVPAYIAMNEKNLKWNYGVAIFTIIKYNPVVAGMATFLLGDFFQPGIDGEPSHSSGLFALLGFLALLIFTAVILAIFLLIGTVKHYKLKKAILAKSQNNHEN